MNAKLSVGKKGLLSILQQNTNEGGNARRRIFEYKNNVERIFDEKSIGKYAPKIKRIIDYVENSEGIVLIYSRYIFSGILPLAFALESRGYGRYNDPNILKDTKQVAGKGKYVIFSGDSKLGNIERDLDKVRSSANRNGDVVKIVLMTQKVSEGVDFKNVREVHIMEPWFNLSRMEQIIGRGIRNNSHRDFADNAKWNVTVYHHVNMFNRSVSSEFVDRESIDYRMYRIAQRKQYEISQVERVLKEGAIDCALNREALSFPKDKLNMTRRIVTSQGKIVNNYILGDVDGSKTCDYKECLVQCSMTDSIETNIASRYTKAVDDKGEQPLFISNIIDTDMYYMMRKIKKMFVKHWNLYGKLFMKYDEIEKALVPNTDDGRKALLLKYTLDDLIRNDGVRAKERQRRFKLEGIEGRLIYRSDKYIFHPTHISDLRIPVNARLLKRFKKPHSVSLNNIIKGVNTMRIIEKNVTSADLKKGDNVTYVFKKKRFMELTERLRPMLNADHEIDKEVVWSMVIDIFDKKTLYKFVKHLTSIGGTIRDPHLLKSMQSSKMYYFDDDDKLVKYFDIYKNKYMEIDGNKINEMTRGNNMRFLKELGGHLDATIKRVIDNKIRILGHVATNQSGNKDAHFKMADDEVGRNDKDNRIITGLVCDNTSKLTKELMYDYITNADKKKVVNSDEIRKKKTRKDMLCRLYEYILRLEGGDAFMRPMYVHRLYSSKFMNMKKVSDKKTTIKNSTDKGTGKGKDKGKGKTKN
jgi:hypothetical protein